MKKVVLYTILLLLPCLPLFAKADVRVIDIVFPPNPPGVHAFGILEPVVTIKNVGGETINSVRIAYYIAIKKSSIQTTGPSTTWTGILPPGESINVQLEAFKHSLEDSHHGIEVFINQINGKQIGVKNNRKISRVFKVKKRSEDIIGSSITKENKKYTHSSKEEVKEHTQPNHSYSSTDKDGIENYLNNLSSTNIDTRIEAAKELARKHHIKGVRLALKDPEKKVRRNAIICLSIKPFNRRGRDSEAVAIFIETLKDIDRDVRAAALRKLEDFSREASSSKIDMDPDICHSIAAILDDPDQNLRYLAVRMLKDCRVKSIENKLLHIAEDNKEPLRIRRIAIVSLSKSNIKGLDEKLIRFLKDESEDNEIKEMAIHSLGKLKSSRAVDIIIPYLYGKDRTLKYVAARALGDIGDPKASNALADVIIDSKGKVNSVVLTSLEKTGSPDVLPKLLEIKPLLDSRGLKRNFLRALGAIGSDSAVEPLLSFIIEDSDDAVQSSASQVLRQFESQTALKTIIDASKKEPGNIYLSSLAKNAQRKLDFPEEELERKRKEQEQNIVLEQAREINKIYNTGHRLFRDKKYEKALPYFLEAVDKYEKLYTSYPAYFRSSLNQIRRIRNTLAGYYRWKVKSPEKAITEYMKLISTVNKFETDERRTSPYWFKLGEVYEKDLKDYQNALDCYKKFSELAEPKDKGHDRNEEILYKWYIDWIAFLQEKIRVIYLKKQQAFSHRTLKYPNMEYGFSTTSLGLFVFTEADFANEFDEEILNPVNNNTYNSIEVLDKFYAKYPDSYRVMFFGTGLFHHCLEENKIDDALLVAEKLIKYYPYDINTLMLQFEISDVYKTQKNNQKHKEAIDKGLKMAKSMNIDIVLSPDQRFSSPDKTMQQFVESLKEGKLWDDLSKEEIKELDILLKKRCKEMSTALEQNDIDKAVSYFYSKSKEKYRKVFSVLPPEIRKKIAKEFTNIRFCEMPSPSNAIYELLSERDGKTYSFQLTFIRDFDGKWYIYQF